jgi:RNA polymerase sigma factor (sigma-70 family)
MTGIDPAGRTGSDRERRPTNSDPCPLQCECRPSGPGSVTIALHHLRDTDPHVRNEAAQRLWERFSPRLCALARRRLNARIRVREDEDDIVQSLFVGFFATQREGGYSLKDREEFWRLMVRMTLCKVANVVHHHQRERRDVRREQAAAGPGRTGDDCLASFAMLAPSRSLSPEAEVISRIELERILAGLDEGQRRILAWKLEGYTNAQIGRKIQRTERTVELKLGLIRRALARDPGVSRGLPGPTDDGNR